MITNTSIAAITNTPNPASAGYGPCNIRNSKTMPIVTIMTTGMTARKYPRAIPKSARTVPQNMQKAISSSLKEHNIWTNYSDLVKYVNQLLL